MLETSEVEIVEVVEVQPENAPEPMDVDTAPATDSSKEAPIQEEDLNIDEEDASDETALLSLPLSKIKRIFRMDSEYVSSSNSAVYATGLATELFIQYLTEQASVYAKLDKRKKLVYKDVSTAASANESLAFLGDTVPKAQPVSTLIAQKKIHLNKKDREKFYPEEAAQESNGALTSPVSKTTALPKGQQTLPLRKAVLHDLMSSD